MESKAEQAVECFDKSDGFSCSQAIFSTYATDFGIDRETALKLSCGLGGGMSRLGHVCGAVSAAALVLGLKYGKYVREDSEAKERTYALVQEFERRFVARNGSPNCNELLGINMLTADKELIKEKHSQICPRLIRDAAEILESFL